MRKLMLALIIAGALLAGTLQFHPDAWRAAASGPTLYLMNAQEDVIDAGRFGVEIWARDAHELAAWEVTLTYDAERFLVLGMSLADDYAVDEANCRASVMRCGVMLGPVLQVEGGSGRALVGSASYGEPVPPSGTIHLATVHLQRVGPGGASTLQLAEPLIANLEANPVIPAVEGVTLTLSEEASDELYVPAVSR